MKRYSEISGDGGSNIVAQVVAQRDRLKSRMDRIRHKVAVMSGKGGVGKSAVTVNLSTLLAMRGYRVGIVDADINGPSVAKMTGVRGRKLDTSENGVLPAIGYSGIKVMSTDMLLPFDETPVAWNGPSSTHAWVGTAEMGMVRELLTDTCWGDLDMLFIDLPPGPNRLNDIINLIPDLNGVIMVTIPSEVSELVVMKSISMVKELKIPILGLIENMGSYICKSCGSEEPLFPHSSVKDMAAYLNISYLGRIPFDPLISQALDKGLPFLAENKDSPSKKAFMKIGEKLIQCTEFQCRASL